MSTVAATRLVCPSWCVLTDEDHAEQLADGLRGGDVTHRNSLDAMAWLTHSVRPDGSVHDDEPEPVLLVDAGPLDVEGAELLVSQLQEALRALRA